MASVAFDHVWKLFGDRAVVADLTFTIVDGEFLVIVGPSGCGKTTSLRMLAGLERPSFGDVRIGERVVNQLPAKSRDISMVFQNYALFPHLTVFENIAFGLRVRREADIERRVQDVAQLLGISGLLGRRPGALSGGERQRVALGRAIIRRPSVFLMDEPLSNLDAALRVQMRMEIGRLHHVLGATMVYVTHDQVEAMTMGDRIAVMAGGALQQIDSPQRLYDRPANLFVGTFIGSPRMNTLPGRLTSAAGAPSLVVLEREWALGALGSDLVDQSSQSITVGVRPEDLAWVPADVGSPDTIEALVEVVEPLGSESFVSGRCGDQSLTVRVPPRSEINVGDLVTLRLDPRRFHLFDTETGRSLRTQST